MSKYNLRPTKARSLSNSESPSENFPEVIRTYTRRNLQSEGANSTKGNMASPTFKDLNEFLTTLSDIDQLCPLVKASGPLDVNKFDFNGFDPKKTLNKLLLLIQSKKKTKTEAVKDLLDIVVIGLTRGNIRGDQVLRTATDDGMNRMRDLIKVYGIKQRLTANEKVLLKNDDFTFIRMTLLFPHISAVILKSSPSIVKNGIKTSLQSELLPNCMKFSGFSGLVPEGLDKELFVMLKYASLAYQVDFSYLINPNLTGKSLKQVYEIQVPFWNAGNKGGWLSDVQRVSYLNALGLNSIVEFRKIVKVAASALLHFCNAKIDEQEVVSRYVKADVIVWPENLVDKEATNHQQLLTNSFVVENQIVSVSADTPGSSGGRINYDNL